MMKFLLQHPPLRGVPFSTESTAILAISLAQAAKFIDLHKGKKISLENLRQLCEAAGTLAENTVVENKKYCLIFRTCLMHCRKDLRNLS